MKFKHLTVHISDIRFDDSAFLLTTPEMKPDITASVKAAGIINPPIVACLNDDGKGGYVIVSGFRRIKAAMESGVDMIDARMAENALEADLIDIAVSENASQRELNPVERSRAFRMYMRVMKNPEAAAGRMNALVNRPEAFETAKTVKKLLPLCGYHADVQSGVVEGWLPLPMAFELGAMQEDECLYFAGLFRNNKTSLGKQREILQNVTEIAAREGLTRLSVMNDETLKSILNDPDMEVNRKTAELRHALKKRRYPAISKVEEIFGELVSELGLKKNVTLEPPQFFEGGSYVLTLRFSGKKELLDGLKSAEDAANHPHMEAILGKIWG